MLIAVAIGSRANFGSLRSAMLALRRRGATVTPVLFASALSDRFGNVPASLERDGFTAVDCVRLSGMADPIDMATVAGSAAIAWSQWLSNETPDAVLVCGDRHEVLGAAMAAAYAGIRLSHVMGGETSGNIDDRVRDAITALADEHCVATGQAALRVRAMLAEEYDESLAWKPYKRIVVTGCPRIDTCKEAIGDTPPVPGNFVMVSQHPVTDRTADENRRDMADTLKAVTQVALEASLAVDLFWPNADAGTDGTHAAIRGWLASDAAEKLTVRTHRAMGPHEYARMMASCTVLVGNSSSGIREGAWIGTPVVNVGSRQRGREMAPNVIHSTVPGKRDELDHIRGAIVAQIAHGLYPRSTLYGDGTAGEQVADVVLGVTREEERRRFNDALRARL